MNSSNSGPPERRIAFDRVFTCLSHPTRRHILTALADGDPREEWEFESPDIEPGDVESGQFQTELYHKHLPSLARSGLIDWDRDSDTITRGPNFEKVQPLIDFVDDRKDELPDDW